MTIVPKKKSDSRSTNKNNVGVPQKQDQDQHHLQDEHNQNRSDLTHPHHPSHAQQASHKCSTSRSDSVVNNVVVSRSNVADDNEVDYSGYNSGDEHTQDRNPSYMQWSEQEFQEKEIQFEKKINKKGWVIRKMAEDGACLFRAVADQIYGDQDMHSVLRKLCIDYIAKNSDYFSQYVTEDFNEYLRRKSLDHSHGNHIEIQAMSEMFNRPIEVYHYSSEPINIFQCSKRENEPIRLSYHRSVHYNSIVDPFKASVGVGLGLPAYDPGVADRTLLEKAIRMSDEDAIEKAMLEDKLLATDWEATNEAIEQQVARESYLEWLRESENRFHKKFKKSTSPQPTTTSALGNNNQSKQLISNQPSYPPPPQQQQQQQSSSRASCSSIIQNTSSSGSQIASGTTIYKKCIESYGEAGTSSSANYETSNYRKSPTGGDMNRRSPRASSSRDIS